MRLIDADPLILKIKDYIEEYNDTDENGYHNLKWCAMKESEMVINNAPTIEAEPIRHGRWEKHPYEREWDVCSCCKQGTKRREFGVNDKGKEWVTEYSYTYCPWCGARMEEHYEID